MKDKKLTWPQRGRLWLRLGLRLVLALLALWLLRAVGLPLLSLCAPFVAALIWARRRGPSCSLWSRTGRDCWRDCAPCWISWS